LDFVHVLLRCDHALRIWILFCLWLLLFTYDNMKGLAHFLSWIFICLHWRHEKVGDVSAFVVILLNAATTWISWTNKHWFSL